ncbi:MAG TPA: restriction endonuclease subunit S [Acidiferrobacteraceae bacterium]|nr:restriction endonuclease subunit S [Acidiferrobacteraceae bacterium]HEX19805.1 restriction endonuclease subunit S [Acidiferrobacteraceae bacterium]
MDQMAHETPAIKPWATVRDMKNDVITRTEFNITEDAVKNSSTNIIKADNVVIATRVGLGKVCLIDQDTAINQDLRGIIPVRPDKLFVRFLFWWLKSISHLIEDEGTGATVQGVKLPFVKSLQIPLPPLPEQKRIVAILDEAFAGISQAVANAEKNLANARELFESYLNNVFTQKGEGWITMRLNDVCSIKHGFAFKSKYFSTAGDHVVLTPGSFNESGGFRDQGKKTKYYNGEIPDGYTLSKGDFLFAMTEQAAGLLGSSLIVPESNCFLHNQRLGLVQVSDGINWDNDFFHHQFNTKFFRAAVQATASGLKVRHTSPSKLGVISISFPGKISEQEKISVGLNTLKLESERLEIIYQQKLTALAELKQSILQKAFAGELTAEPAKLKAMA